MSARETRRRWLPGRQTLSRVEPEQRDSAPPDNPNEQKPSARYDPVYDWFDLRRARVSEEEGADRS